MSDCKSLMRPCSLGWSVLLLLFFLTNHGYGGLVNVSTSSANGTSNRDSNSNFVGVLDSAIPTTVTGLSVAFPNVPNGEVFVVGDVVGRDVDDSGGGRTWEYVLSLPADAAPGTGFTDIAFAGHAFERPNNNLEGADELVWELFLNGSSVAVDSATTGAGVDFTSIDINLANPGGAATTEAVVRLTVNDFNVGSEWFAARGTLSANFETIPEPNVLMIFSLTAVGLSQRRRRKR